MDGDFSPRARYSGGPMKKLAFPLVLLVLALGCGSVKSGGDGDGDGDGADGGDDGVNDPPTDIQLSASAVEEQAPPGSEVGVLAAVDADASDTHSFELVDDGGGLFVVDGDRLEVAPGAIPNYETGASATVTVKVTDSGGLGLERDFDIDILDLREVVNTLDSGEGSLRQTIADAEPGETILFETGLDSSISVNSVLLLTKNVTIRGPLPPAEIVLDALGNNRVFDVSPAATVTLQNLRIRGGQSTTSGAIQNEGVLTVERCIFEDNLADSFGRGGAIYNQNTLVARDTLFRRNRAYNNGAISADGDGGTTIERCTFFENQTTGNSGGAVGGGWLKIINSTFRENVASDPSLARVGGALAIFYADSEIDFSTIVLNSANGQGGGIYCAGSEGAITLTLRGTIVSTNDAPTGPDVSVAAGCTVVADHSVIHRGAGSTVTDGEGGSVVGTGVQVGALRDNGGLTPTVVPQAGSASIDLVPAASCTRLDGEPLTEDQRGEARPAGDACDAGAVEQ
jgi:hypothetical protein